MMGIACRQIQSTPVQLRADELHLNSLGRAQRYISLACTTLLYLGTHCIRPHLILYLILASGTFTMFAVVVRPNVQSCVCLQYVPSCQEATVNVICLV